MRLFLICISAALSLLLSAATLNAAEPAEQLFGAAKEGDVAAVKEALAAGADVNAKTKYGATALSFAADHGNVDVVRALIEAGADVNVKDTFYKATPLSWAADRGFGEIVGLLLKNKAEGADDALRAAAEKGLLGVAAAVVEHGAPKAENVLDSLALAELRGHQQVAELLQKHAPETATPPVVVSAELLAKYVGEYESEQGWQYTVSLSEGRLLLGSPYREPVPLRAKSETAFAFFGGEYSFEIAEDGAATMTQGSGESATKFVRVEAAAKTTPAAAPAQRAHDEFVSSPHWPSFRGDGARGIADGMNVPWQWDVTAEEGVRWKTPIPGLAHACPIVWGERIYITTAVSDDEERQLRAGLYGDVDSAADDEATFSWQVLCLDRQSGKVLWNQTARRGKPSVKRHPKSTFANPTPATDGKHVVASFGAEGLYCYDTNGELLWKKDLGRLDSGWFYDDGYQWGFASSPIIYQNMVIVQCDVQENSFIAAIDIDSGEFIWKTPRDEIPTWSTPTVYEGPQGAVLLTNGTNFARAYDPDSGEELWRLSGNSEIAVPTPFVAGGLAYIASGYRPIKPIYAVRLDARGDISLPGDQTASESIAWSVKQGGPYLPTPIVYGGYLYSTSNSGVLTCYDAASGAKIYQNRLRSGAAKSFTGSPIAADGRLYFTSEEGIVLVVQAGEEFKLLAANPLGDTCLSTPAATDGLLIFRTLGHLVAIDGAVSANEAAPR